MKDPNHSLALGFVGLLGLALFSAACTTGGDSTTDGDSTSSSSGGGASAGSAGGSGGVATTSGDGGNGGATTSSGEGGSATTTNGEGGSGGATTTNTSSSAGGAGGTGGAATSSSSSTEVSCDELRAQLAAALDKAQACSLASTKPIAECNAVVAGLCCPTVVAREGSDEANAYLALLATLQGRGDCASGCPDVLCKEITGGTCEKDPGSSSGTIGVCVASNSIDM